MRSQAGDPAVTHPTGCTVCDEDCNARFTCSLCGKRRSVCWFRVGGFHAKHDICSICISEINSVERRRIQRGLAKARRRLEILSATRERM